MEYIRYGILNSVLGCPSSARHVSDSCLLFFYDLLFHQTIIIVDAVITKNSSFLKEKKSRQPNMVKHRFRLPCISCSNLITVWWGLGNNRKEIIINQDTSKTIMETLGNWSLENQENLCSGSQRLSDDILKLWVNWSQKIIHSQRLFY